MKLLLILFLVRFIRKVNFDIFDCLYCNIVAEKKKQTNIICRNSMVFPGYVLLQSRLNPLNVCKLVSFLKKLHAAGLQILKRWTHSHTRFKIFYPVFNYLSRTIQGSTYRNLCSSIFNMRVKKPPRRLSVIP